MRKTILAVAAAGLLGGCAAERLRMDVPADLALHGEALPVASRFIRTGKSPVRFGDYSTTAHYGWALPTATTSGHGETLGVGRERMRYGFTLAQGARRGPEVRCHASQQFIRLGGPDDHLDLAVASNVPVLACEIGEGTMSLYQRDASISGEFERPGAAPVHIRGQQTVLPVPIVGGNPFGYVFNAEGRDIMAVDLNQPGTVWIGQPLDVGTRDALAAAAAALLMTQ